MSELVRGLLLAFLILMMLVCLAGMWWIPTMMSTYPLFMLVGNIVMSVFAAGCLFMTFRDIR